jgi:hypothetical protein
MFCDIDEHTHTYIYKHMCIYACNQVEYTDISVSLHRAAASMPAICANSALDPSVGALSDTKIRIESKKSMEMAVSAAMLARIMHVLSAVSKLTAQETSLDEQVRALRRDEADAARSQSGEDYVLENETEFTMCYELQVGAGGSVASTHALRVTRARPGTLAVSDKEAVCKVLPWKKVHFSFHRNTDPATHRVRVWFESVPHWPPRDIPLHLEDSHRLVYSYHRGHALRPKVLHTCVCVIVMIMLDDVLMFSVYVVWIPQGMMTWHAPSSSRKGWASSKRAAQETILSSVKTLTYEHLPKVPQSSWIPDAASTMCVLCYNYFDYLVHRHHCRFCGALVCDNCSKRTIHNARACDTCYDTEAVARLHFKAVHDPKSRDAASPVKTKSASGRLEVHIVADVSRSSVDHRRHLSIHSPLGIKNDTDEAMEYRTVAFAWYQDQQEVGKEPSQPVPGAKSSPSYASSSSFSSSRVFGTPVRVPPGTQVWLPVMDSLYGQHGKVVCNARVQVRKGIPAVPMAAAVAAAARASDSKALESKAVAPDSQNLQFTGWSGPVSIQYPSAKSMAWQTLFCYDEAYEEEDVGAAHEPDLDDGDGVNPTTTLKERAEAVSRRRIELNRLQLRGWTDIDNRRAHAKERGQNDDAALSMTVITTFDSWTDRMRNAKERNRRAIRHENAVAGGGGDAEGDSDAKRFESAAFLPLSLSHSSQDASKMGSPEKKNVHKKKESRSRLIRDLNDMLSLDAKGLLTPQNALYPVCNVVHFVKPLSVSNFLACPVLIRLKACDSAHYKKLSRSKSKLEEYIQTLPYLDADAVQPGCSVDNWPHCNPYRRLFMQIQLPGLLCGWSSAVPLLSADFLDSVCDR